MNDFFCGLMIGFILGIFVHGIQAWFIFQKVRRKIDDIIQFIKE